MTGSAIIDHVGAKIDIHFIGLLIAHDTLRQNCEHLHIHINILHINQHTYKHTQLMQHNTDVYMVHGYWLKPLQVINQSLAS